MVTVNGTQTYGITKGYFFFLLYRIIYKRFLEIIQFNSLFKAQLT